MALSEMAGAGGIMLLVGRVLHAIGIQILRAPNVLRFVGTLLFWLSLGLFSGLTLLYGLING